MARGRLLCFAHAGGSSAAFLGWSAPLTTDLELRVVMWPGRDRRSTERPVQDLRDAVAAIADEVAGDRTLPWILVGHSFGALMAVLVAAELARRGMAPAHVVVSGKAPPPVADEAAALLSLGDDALLVAMREQYGGAPVELDALPLVREETIRHLREDLSLMAQVDAAWPRPLDIPATITWGEADASVSPAEMARWCEHFAGAVRLRPHAGGHFAAITTPLAILDHIRAVATDLVETRVA